MKVFFCWQLINNDVEPIFYSDHKNEDGVDLIGCLLMDDGGIGYSRSIAWLDEGLRLVANFKSGKVSDQNWARETWGAFFQGENVEIYSLHDESYSDSIQIDRFEKILVAWRDFIAGKPILGVCTHPVEY